MKATATDIHARGAYNGTSWSPEDRESGGAVTSVSISPHSRFGYGRNHVQPVDKIKEFRTAAEQAAVSQGKESVS
jgi:hypothetical protein